MLCAAWTIALVQYIRLYHSFGISGVHPINKSYAEYADLGMLGKIVRGMLPMDVLSIYHFAGGAVVASLLSYLYAAFASFPIHPLGVAFASFHWTLEPYGLNIMVAFAIKSLVFRWGGARVYRLTTSIALGLVIGAVIASFPGAIRTLYYFYFS